MGKTEKTLATTKFSVFDYEFEVWIVKNRKCPACKANSLIQIGREVSMSFVPAIRTCCECGWAKVEE